VRKRAFAHGKSTLLLPPGECQLTHIKAAWRKSA
jgi:hypothetical protein